MEEPTILPTISNASNISSVNIQKINEIKESITKCIDEAVDGYQSILNIYINSLTDLNSINSSDIKETKIAIFLKNLIKNFKSQLGLENTNKIKNLLNRWKNEYKNNKSSENGDVKESITYSSSNGLKRRNEPSNSQEDNIPNKMPKIDLPLCGDAQRDKVRQRLYEALQFDVDVNFVVSVENELFLNLNSKDYISKFRSIRHNLTDPSNPDFLEKVKLLLIPPQEFPYLSADDMSSFKKMEERRKNQQFSLEECQSDWSLRNGAVQASGMFQCGKCKKSRTTYFQMQTRSSDEPMTTFVTCLECNNRWKF